MARTRKLKKNLRFWPPKYYAGLTLKQKIQRKKEIESHKTDGNDVEYVSDNERIEKIYQDDTIVKLFYREHYKYDCFSRNWGDCKGENHYNDVCVVLNKTTLEKYENEKLHELKPITKNKFYVACSRANNNLYFVSENEIKHHKN